MGNSFHSITHATMQVPYQKTNIIVRKDYTWIILENFFILTLKTDYWVGKEKWHLRIHDDRGTLIDGDYITVLYEWFEEKYEMEEWVFNLVL